MDVFNKMSKWQCNYQSNNSRQCSEEVHQQGFFDTKSSVNKHSKISYFLWNFMKEYCNSSRDTNLNTHQITCSNNQSIYEIMDRISHEIHDRKWVCMSLCPRRYVTVSPMKNLLHNKTKYNRSKNNKRCMHFKVSMFY